MFTLAQLADLTQSQLIGDPAYPIHNVSDLESATPKDAAFFNKLPYGQLSRYEQIMLKSAAGVIFVHPETSLIAGRNYLLHDNPSRAFQITLEALNGTAQKLTGFPGIHPSAIIHPQSKIGAGVSIGPLTIIDEGTVIGDRTHIGAGCFIGPECIIGTDCILHANVTLRERCEIGHRVILQPGVVIGSCGFGYATDAQGHHIKLNQIGTVTVEDDVEIGANTTIDRSRFKTTRICKGTKIDNLVQIGHGAIIGPDNMIVSQTGIAGSTETGRHVVLAGQCGVAGHIKLGDGVIMAARSGVDKSMPHAGKYGGNPAIPLSKYNRITVLMRNIEEYVKLIKSLEERLNKLESQQ
jgi:UDP-3-O-[3-hydroxymyristoyl] glucosamine N-acyltransferase